MNALVVEGLPVVDPVLIFALAMLVFLISPLVFQRYRLPGIVGVIGPVMSAREGAGCGAACPGFTTTRPEPNLKP